MPAGIPGLCPSLRRLYRPKYTYTPGVICRPVYQGQPGPLRLYRPKYTYSPGVICRPAYQGQPGLHYLYRSMSIHPPALYAGRHNRVSLGHTTYICLCLYTLLHYIPAGTIGLAQAILPIYAYIYIPSYIICRPAYQGQPGLYHLYRSISIYPPTSYASQHTRVSPGYTTYIYPCLYTLLHYMPAGTLGLAQAIPPVYTYIYELSSYYNNVYISSRYYIPTSIRQQRTRLRRLYMPIYIYPPALYAGRHTQFSLGHATSRY